MSAQGTYRFYSVQRQTILLVNGEPLGRERDKRLTKYQGRCFEIKRLLCFMEALFLEQFLRVSCSSDFPRVQRKSNQSPIHQFLNNQHETK